MKSASCHGVASRGGKAAKKLRLLSIDYPPVENLYWSNSAPNGISQKVCSRHTSEKSFYLVYGWGGSGKSRPHCRYGQQSAAEGSEAGCRCVEISKAGKRCRESTRPPREAERGRAGLARRSSAASQANPVGPGAGFRASGRGSRHAALLGTSSVRCAAAAAVH